MVAIFETLYFLQQLIQPFLVPICLISAWALVILVIWTATASIRDSVGRAKKMHQIPCANCQFFTGDYRLKCTVHPSNALSDDAINCTDYEATTGLFTLQQEIDNWVPSHRRTR